MKLSQTIFYLLTFLTTIHALALPSSFADLTSASKDLFKRKGGGGGGGKGGSGSSSSSSGEGSSGSSSSSSGSSSSGSSSSSSSGTKGGSGSTSSSSTSASAPRYGSSSSSYAGGSSTAYRTGSRSTGGIAPYFVGGAALALFPGLWLYGAYAYNWPNTYTYHNNSANTNETHPVSCYCAQYAECGCDANNDTSYLDSVANNASLSTLADVNGTQTLLINGTLPNGTEDATTTGGAGMGGRGLVEAAGWWVVVAGVGWTVWFM